MQFSKAVGDIRLNCLSMSVILLVLILGAAGVMAALNTREILRREIDKSVATANAPDINIWFEAVDAALLAKVAQIDGVAAVDMRRTALMRIRAKNGTWLPLNLTIKPNFSNQALGVVHLHDAHDANWPKDSGGIFIEQSGRALLGLAASDSLQIRTPTGEISNMAQLGFVHDPMIAPSQQEGIIYGYATPDGAAQIGQPQAMNQLLIKLQPPAAQGPEGNSNDAQKRTSNANRASTAQIAQRLEAVLEANGTPALRIDTLSNAHPHALLMAALLRVMVVFAALSALCAMALANYLVSAWMRREVRQMGIMKALGARTGQIIRQYLMIVVPMVCIATVIAIPLGNVASDYLVRFNQISLNIDITDWQVPMRLRWQEIALLFTLPLCAALVAIGRAARVTARAAMHDPSISVPVNASSGNTKFAVRVFKMQSSIGVTYALRNVFRRPWRSFIMTIALGCGGALLMTTNSMYDGLLRVIDVSLAHQGHDIELLLNRAAPRDSVEAIARSVPQVTNAQATRRRGVSVLRESDAANHIVHHDGDNAVLIDYPVAVSPAQGSASSPTTLFKLPLVAGRWPRIDINNEVLVTQMFMDKFDHIKLGMTMPLRVNARRVMVRVVGVVEEIAASAMYAPEDNYDAIVALTPEESASVNGVRVVLSANSSAADLDTVVAALDTAFLAAKLPPKRILSRAGFRDSLDEHFKVVGDVVRITAIAIALLGAIILCATTTLNIAERLREIAIMRSLGATPLQIERLFFIEAFAVAGLSVVFALALSLALTFMVFKAAQSTLLHVNVPMYFSISGFLQVCFGAVIVMATVWIAMRFALRQSVRAALAYE
jgi:putative ABC transport system permease protein